MMNHVACSLFHHTYTKCPLVPFWSTKTWNQMERIYEPKISKTTSFHREIQQSSKYRINVITVLPRTNAVLEKRGRPTLGPHVTCNWLVAI